MELFFSVGAGVLLSGAAGTVAGAAAVSYYGNPFLKATTALGTVVNDVENKLHDTTYRLDSFVRSKRKSWRRLLGRDAVDLHQEKWAISTQAAICYSHIMTVNSGFLKQQRPPVDALWCPCVIPPDIAFHDTFVKTRDCINDLYNQDLGTRGRTTLLCNDYQYSEEHGMIMFYLRTSTPCEFVHVSLDMKVEGHLLEDRNGKLIGVEPDGVELRFDEQTGELDLERGSLTVLKSALALIQWKSRVELLLLDNPPKGFISLPISHALSRMHPGGSGSDFNELIRTTLHQLGRAQAYMTSSPMPPSFSEYKHRFGIDVMTMQSANESTRAYYNERILPLFNLSPMSLTRAGVNSLYWSDRIFPNLIFYTTHSFVGLSDSSLEPSDSHRETADDLTTRMFDSQYRITTTV